MNPQHPFEITRPAGSSAGHPAPAQACASVGGYLLLRAIGRGSYGEVWLARSKTGSFHALKMVCRKDFEHEQSYEREYSRIQKFEPLSRLQPSQLAILEVGRDPAAGYFYYVMELADDERSGSAAVHPGQTQAGAQQFSRSAGPLDPETYRPKTLKSVLAQKSRLPYEEALQVGLSLTAALEHLHQHSLVHRDITPGNVVFVNGVPKLADIGLVIDLDTAISQVGAEGFMPPEGPGTVQGDIFSLGKVLYEISTGRDRLSFPELPAGMDEFPDKQGLLELNLVVLRACQHDRRMRYQSAGEMHAELALLQSGQSLHGKRVRRRRARLCKLAVLAGIGLLAALGVYLAFVN